MKIIFFGSDDFALAYLEKLGEAHELVACVTQPDKPKGRGMHLTHSPIKDWAIQHNVKIFQPERIKDEKFYSELKALQADLFVVIAYGKILPAQLLATPRYSAINVHGSLLPKYRGAAPINWAIINGDKETGLTVIKMSPDLDAGEIIAQQKFKIEDNDTSVSIREKMKSQGPEFLLKTIIAIEKKSCTFIAQNVKDVTHAPKLVKELGHIHWEKSAQDIYNLTRGLLPWPGAYTFFKGKLLKITSCEVIMHDVSQIHPGTVVEVTKKGFVVAAKQNAILVKEVHLEAAKPMDALSFLRGHRVEVGFIFDK